MHIIMQFKLCCSSSLLIIILIFSKSIGNVVFNNEGLHCVVAITIICYFAQRDHSALPNELGWAYYLLLFHVEIDNPAPK